MRDNGGVTDETSPTPSPLLGLPGAVSGDRIDAPVAAHYGSFNGEQRRWRPATGSSTCPTVASSGSPDPTGWRGCTR